MSYTPGDYDAAHIYLQWGGLLPGGEQWSCGLRLAGPPSEAVAKAASLVDDWGANIKTFHENGSTGISPRALLSYVKANAISGNGHYSADVTNMTAYANIPGGGTVGNTPPNQVALCVTLTTGFSRGPAHKGRIYLPLPTFGIDASGAFAAANAQAVSGTVDTLIANLNGVDAAWDVSVFSRKAGAAAHRPVTGNLVGRVYDTQRRRRRSMVEDYQ
jgi:hypothetical protein